MSDPTDPNQAMPPPPPVGGSTPPPPPAGWSTPPASPSGDGTGGGNKTVLLIVGGVLALIVLIVGAVVVFSGDDGGDALSEAEYVAQFNEICVGISNQIDALDADTVEEAQVAATEAVGIVETGIRQLRDLQPPSEIADDVGNGIDALAQTGDVFGQLANADDEDEFIEIGSQIDDARQEADDALNPLGIECEASDDSSSDDSSGDDTSGDDSSGDESSGGVPDAEPAAAISDYGTDAEFDDLADNCEAGDFDACDDLFISSPSGSGYEDYGDSCGARNDPAGFCTTIYADAG